MLRRLLRFLQLHGQLGLDGLHLELMLLLDFVQFRVVLHFGLLEALVQPVVVALGLLQLVVQVPDLRGQLVILLLKFINFISDGLFDVVPALLLHADLLFVLQDDLLVLIILVLVVFDFFSVLVVFYFCVLHLLRQNLVPGLFAAVQLVQALVGQLS